MAKSKATDITPKYWLKNVNPTCQNEVVPGWTAKTAPPIPILSNCELLMKNIPPKWINLFISHIGESITLFLNSNNII